MSSQEDLADDVTRYSFPPHKTSRSNGDLNSIEDKTYVMLTISRLQHDLLVNISKDAQLEPGRDYSDAHVFRTVLAVCLNTFLTRKLKFLTIRTGSDEKMRNKFHERTFKARADCTMRHFESIL